jgi:hypothetical protein
LPAAPMAALKADQEGAGQVIGFLWDEKLF